MRKGRTCSKFVPKKYWKKSKFHPFPHTLDLFWYCFYIHEYWVCYLSLLHHGKELLSRENFGDFASNPIIAHRCEYTRGVSTCLPAHSAAWRTEFYLPPPPPPLFPNHRHLSNLSNISRIASSSCNGTRDTTTSSVSSYAH